MTVKIKCPVTYKGKETSPIDGFTVGPDGMERQRLIEDILRKDEEKGGKLRFMYMSGEMDAMLKVREVFVQKLDTVYHINPGDEIEVPDDHAEILLKTYGFLQRADEEPTEVKS